ncbi:MAG: twin-arginine translocation signal domain-containing protein [Planctomycetota bacterium]|nr:twin-arginine translocation signal domain-containing protein [Planctomycetota bacterium]
MDRRSLLKAAGAAAGLAAAGVVTRATEAADGCCKDKQSCIHFKNEFFYDAQGKFDVEKGQDAVLALCKYHGYPIFPGLREKLWIADYGVGKFTEVGLAAYMFCNNVEDHYMLMDIFLLPGQMLPEHWHVEGEGNPAKREGWLVRWGLSHIVGIGEKGLSKEVVVPKTHMGGKVTTEHETIATPGMFVKLAKVETRHWQYAGPEGAIITEVANVHTNSAVRHSDPVLNKNFLDG